MVAPIGWIREIVLDSSDPLGLARFWAGLLGGEPVEWYPGWITLEPPPHGQRLSFQGTGAGGGSCARRPGRPDRAFRRSGQRSRRRPRAGHRSRRGPHRRARPPGRPRRGTGPVAGLLRPRGSPVLPGDPVTAPDPGPPPMKAAASAPAGRRPPARSAGPHRPRQRGGCRCRTRRPSESSSIRLSKLSAEKMVTTVTAAAVGQYSAITRTPSGYFHAARRISAPSRSAAGTEARKRKTRRNP